MDFVFDYGFGYSAFQIIFYLIFATVIGDRKSVGRERVC